MIKIWAKTIKNHKIKKQFVYESNDAFEYSLMRRYLSEIADNLDIPTPLIIKTHIFDYAKFNYVRFNKTDFVEKIDFDFLVLENIAEK